MDRFRKLLQSVPTPVSVTLLLVLTAGVLWWGYRRTANADTYEQPPMTMRCTQCGYTETLSVEDYAAKLSKELPNGAALVQGPAMKCPKCGKRSFVVGSSAPSAPAGANPPGAR